MSEHSVKKTQTCEEKWQKSQTSEKSDKLLLKRHKLVKKVKN